MKSKLILSCLFLLTLMTASAGEVWIVESPFGSTPGGSGTASSPYTVPVGDSTTFDTLIGAQPSYTTVHVGAGTFLVERQSTASTLEEGCSLVGSGMGITTIKLADSSLDTTRNFTPVVWVTSTGPENGAFASVRDLTVDCNSENQTCQSMTGVGYAGTFVLIENVEIMGLGSRDEYECFGVFGGYFDPVDQTQGSHVIIRNCRVVKPWASSAGGISAFHPSGDNNWSGVVEGCYVDLSSATLSRHAGLAFAGSAQGLVIAHNTVIGSYRGVHVDTAGNLSPKASRGVIIAHNRIYDCNVGIGIGGESNTAVRSDAMEKYLIEGNSIEMLRGGRGIELWGQTTAFQVRNNTITKNVNAPGSTSRTGIYVSSGAQSHVISGNRFDFAGDAYFTMIDPYSTNWAATASQNNRFEDNTFTSEVLVPKLFTSFRKASNPAVQPLPAGSSTWQFTLGGGQGDNNPTTQLVSSDTNGNNRYVYMRMSPLPGNSFVGNSRTWFDPDGTSGVYVGSATSGNLGVGGWVLPNSGFGLAQGGRMVVLEGGSAPIMGSVTLVAGTATVATGAARPTSRIFLTQQQDGGTPGAVRVSSRSPGSSFTITSTSATDTSTVAWFIIDPSY